MKDSEQIPSTSCCFGAGDVLVRVWKVAHELPEEGRLALFDAQKSQLVILNSIGAAFWSRLDGVRSLKDIALEISQDVQDAPEPSEVIAESFPFLIDLIERGAVSFR